MSTFYAVSGPDLLTPLHTFCESIISYLPNVVTLTIEPSGDTIDDVNGDLTGTWTGDAEAASSGITTSGYAAPVGACVTWLSPIVRDGGRIRGRTFIVPLAQEAYQDDGTLIADYKAMLAAAAAGLVVASGGNMRIWHRPRLAQAASPGHRALTAHDGSQAAVTASSVRDKVAVLRSRRD